MVAKRKVLVTDYVWPSLDLEQQLLSEAGLELVAAPNGDEQTLISLARDSVGILTCFAKVTADVLRSATNLQVVGRYGVGVDNIDVEIATQLGIAVTYVPDYCVDEVSDHTIAMILAWNRRLVLFDTGTKRQGWGSVKLDMPIMRLRGKKLGIIGFGRIGVASAAKAAAFGMDILAYDPIVSAEQLARKGARPVDLETLLKEADFITLHMPLTPKTHGIISKKELGLMKSSAVIVNTARGPLIDIPALVEALRDEQIAGAALDVLETDQPPLDHPLMAMGNVLLTPHVAFYSKESIHELEERATGEVVRVLNGQMPDNLYNKDVLGNSRARLVEV